MLKAIRSGAGWHGDEVSYAGRHMRLRAAFGSASSHSCVVCDRPAADWSLNAGVPIERLRGDDAGPCQGLPFSLEDADYSARCSACHAKLDGWGQSKRKTWRECRPTSSQYHGEDEPIGSMALSRYRLDPTPQST
jgi:hypothetical protein